MKLITLAVSVILLLSFSLCLAQQTPVEKAYSLYYKGQKEEAINIMEEYVDKYPDPAAFYFLGYAYYEMNNMNKAAKYFNEAYIRSPYYSPMPDME